MNMQTLILFLAVTLYSGCGGGCNGGIVSPPPLHDPRPEALVEAAKQAIAAKRYPDALIKCTAAEELDDSYDEAKYCVLAANVGSLVQSVASILSLVVTQLSPAGYQTQLNAKQLLSSVLGDIEAQMAYIDLYAYKLAAMENPHFQIDDFPLGLDPSDLLSIIGKEVECTRA